MKFKEYIKDKMLFLTIWAVILAIVSMFLIAFKVERELFIVLIGTILCGLLGCLLIDYIRKKTFYNTLLKNIKELDKAYLVTATLDNPDFLEGRLTTEAIYEIGKSMNENINKLIKSQSDFKEYLELWIHEVKIPLSALQLMLHNNKNSKSASIQEQIRRIETYVDQILYYVRQETPEKDYLIKEVHLDKIITNIALKNKDTLLAKNINLRVHDVKNEVFTDSKWLEFIIDQIVDNAIKYSDPQKESYIEISSHLEKEAVVLTVKDNGVGIPSEDLSRVFDKSFTGQNGRIRTKSTGMGLYIVKNLIQKLGHKIEISSELNEYTCITLTFYQNDYYRVIK